MLWTTFFNIVSTRFPWLVFYFLIISPHLHCWLFMVTLTLTRCSNSLRRRQWHSTPVLLPGKSHGWRSLVVCSPWGCWELDTTHWLHFPFSLSCIGEGNGSPLQYSCLENPRDGGTWWAAFSGVAQSQTRLKRLSSSSSMSWLEPGYYVINFFHLVEVSLSVRQIIGYGWEYYL